MANKQVQRLDQFCSIHSGSEFWGLIDIMFHWTCTRVKHLLSFFGLGAKVDILSQASVRFASCWVCLPWKSTTKNWNKWVHDVCSN